MKSINLGIAMYRASRFNPGAAASFACSDARSCQARMIRDPGYEPCTDGRFVDAETEQADEP